MAFLLDMASGSGARWRAFALAILVILAGGLAASAATLVPPGNRSAEQPPIPGGSASRTQALKTTYEAKYQKVYRLLAKDSKLRSKIKEAAATYGIDPLHIDRKSTRLNSSH